MNAIIRLFNAFRTSKLRLFLWPIRSYEFKIFFPLVFLLFTFVFSLNIIRVIKDSLIITRVAPEVIGFIKLWIEMPVGALFVLFYTKMVNKVSTEKLLQWILIIFGITFTFLGFVVFPYVDVLHPSQQFVDYYVNALPNLRWFIVIISKWSYVLFYVLGELWPVIVVAFAFWQLANKVVSTEQAQRFYPFFGLFAHANLIACGTVVWYFKQDTNILSSILLYFGYSDDVMIKSMIIMIDLIIIVALISHKRIEKFIVYNDKIVCQTKNKLLELDIAHSLKIIFSSRYLGLITVLMLSYSMSVNLIEGLWMSKARALYSDSTSFMVYQSEVLFYTGIFCLMCDILCNYTIRRFGWFIASVATPVVTLIVGSGFFLSVLLQDPIATFLNMKPLILIAFLGGLQNVLIKGIKYSLFDDTKEMLYIPLDNELKTKGKAAVDIMGMKIGKSSGSIVQFVIFTIFPSARYENIAQYLAIFFIITCVVWIYSTIQIKKIYYRIIQ